MESSPGLIMMMDNRLDPQNVLHEDDQSILVAGSSPISCNSSLWKGHL